MFHTGGHKTVSCTLTHIPPRRFGSYFRDGDTPIPRGCISWLRQPTEDVFDGDFEPSDFRSRAIPLFRQDPPPSDFLFPFFLNPLAYFILF